MSKPRVLVVDDDTFMLGLVAKLLSAKGYEVYQADHGDTALEIAAQGRLDLVLLDVLLPGDDGYSVCKRIKAEPHNASVPVIFLTGMRGDREMIQGFKAGGADYVVKPFEPEVLLARVKAHTELSTLSRELRETKDEQSTQLGAIRRHARDLCNSVILADEGERLRLAKLLEDDAIQQLALAGEMLEGGGDDHKPKGRLAEATRLIGAAGKQLDALATELDPGVIGQTGLFKAIAGMARALAKERAIDIRCRQTGDASDLPRAMEITLLRGARELMVSSARLAKASHLEIELRFEADAVELILEDNGTASHRLPEDSTEPLNDQDAGLSGLVARVEILGGSLSSRKRPPTGNRLRLLLPLYDLWESPLRPEK